MNEVQDRIDVIEMEARQGGGTGGDVTIQGGCPGVSGIDFITAAPRLISFVGPNNKEVVRVYYDGTVEYGEGYKPSTAAKLFWQAVRWYGQGNG